MWNIQLDLTIILLACYLKLILPRPFRSCLSCVRTARIFLLFNLPRTVAQNKIPSGNVVSMFYPLLWASFAIKTYDYCLISYRGGLGTSLCIMGYGTQHPHSRKEHIELYNILKFGVNQANIRRDTAIQKLKNLLRNVWNAGHTSGVPYIS